MLALQNKWTQNGGKRFALKGKPVNHVQERKKVSSLMPFSCFLLHKKYISLKFSFAQNTFISLS